MLLNNLIDFLKAFNDDPNRNAAGPGAKVWGGTWGKALELYAKPFKHGIKWYQVLLQGFSFHCYKHSRDQSGETVWKMPCEEGNEITHVWARRVRDPGNPDKDYGCASYRKYLQPLPIDVDNIEQITGEIEFTMKSTSQ